MHTTCIAGTTNHEVGIRQVHDAIATRVAAALEAGGATWDVTEPVIREYLEGDWSGAPPVVLARALGRTQRHQAAEAVIARERGDEARAEALAARLESARMRLADVLGH